MQIPHIKFEFIFMIIYAILALITGGLSLYGFIYGDIEILKAALYMLPFTLAFAFLPLIAFFVSEIAIKIRRWF